MTTEHIQQIFNEYIEADKTQYAILLNGGWGCGKTYFWKNTLEDISKNFGLKPIYISLNGISKIDNLEYKLFTSLLKSTKNNQNKLRKRIISISEKPLNILTTNFLKSNLTDLINGLSIDIFDFSRCIVCFDDLERCQIDVKEVLGFINNFVEHKYLKTIILANEPEINNLKKEDQFKEDNTTKEEDQSKEDDKAKEEDQSKEAKVYYQIKEKVIGRDLKFEIDISSTLPKLFEKYKNTDFYGFLAKQQSYIIGILIEYNQYNLRTISFYFDILERIFPTLKNVKDRYIQEIILFSAIIAIEYKNGVLTSNDYKNFKGIDNFILMSISHALNSISKEKKSENKEKKKAKSYSEIFYKNYLVNRSDSYFFYPSIYSYILSGYFNQSELEKEIQNRKPKIISKEVQDFNALSEFYELSDDHFKLITKDVLQYAKEGKYFIHNYIHIAEFFYSFCENELITEDKKEIEKILLEGLDIAKERAEIKDSTLEDFLRIGSKNPDVSVIVNKVKEIHDKIKEEQYIANSKKLIEFLNEDKFKLKKFFEENSLSKELFPYIDKELLLDTILNISNKQIYNFDVLINFRYYHDGIGKILFEDKDCLEKLKEGLLKYLNNNNEIKQLRKFLYNKLIKTLNDSINHLDKTRRK